MKSLHLRLPALAAFFLTATLHAQVTLPPLAPPAVPPQPAAIPPPTAPDPNALKWDAETKEVNPKPGDLAATYSFVVTNVSDHDVMLNALRTSCGCTVAQLPSTPYKLEPGAKVVIAVTLDLRGKSGTLTKTVTVASSAEIKSLIVRANIPQAAPGATPVAPGPVPVTGGLAGRAMNIQNALADRQAIFKGDCATCHVDKGVGKLGVELYAASCGICHEVEHRAAMVPDLKLPRSPRDLAFWQKWIAEGQPGTLMPAFAAAHGGPLTQEQADSLAVYLYQTFPRPAPSAAPPWQPIALSRALTPHPPQPQSEVTPENTPASTPK